MPKKRVSHLITPKHTKLHIGCGREHFEGFVNIDKAPEVEPDLVVDIEKGFPFQDDSFDYIYSAHCLEHVRPDFWSFVLNELSRIAKEGCILELKLPFDNLGQRTNCDHYRTFSWNSFDQLCEQSSRNYYSNLTLVNLKRTPNKLTKLFFYLFPFLKYEVHFKFRVLKNHEKNKKDH